MHGRRCGKASLIHDRRNGNWGPSLGQVKTPGIGKDIRLTAAVSGESAALVATDGKKTWRTPAVKISNTKAGKTGLWFFQVGKAQAFENFDVSESTFEPKQSEEAPGQPELVDVAMPDLPSPQDWVLVLKRENRK